MLVKEIMTRSVKTVTSKTPLTEVVSLMCLYRYSGIPVVEEDILIGIIAEKDILASLLPTADDLKDGMAAIDFDRLLADYASAVKGTVDDLMTRSVKSVPADMHILKAASVMTGHRFRRIPVADGDKLLGMLSLGDVHKAIFHRNLSAAGAAA
jgi:CBS domain-containing protein